MKVDLQGKVILITGGTQGLGQGIAEFAAQNGARGIAICGRNQDRGEKVVSGLADMGCEAVFIQADLLDQEAPQKMAEVCAEKWGVLHGLVNAAASTERGNLDNTTPALWDRIMHLNLRAPFFLMQACLPLLREATTHLGTASVVNILSVSGHGGQPFLAPYSTSKGALGVLTKNLAHAHRSERIRFNGLNIGWMATPNEDLVQKSEGASDDWLEKADASMPFGRILRPGDVARFSGYLLSDEARMMTGSIIDFDQNVFGAYD